MPSTSVDDAVHATDLPPKSKHNAVVVPQAEHSTVDATDVKLEGSKAQSSFPPTLVLDTRGFLLYARGALSVVLVGAWCVFFAVPRLKMEFDANAVSTDEILAKMVRYDRFLSLPRIFFSKQMGAEIAIIITALFVPARLRSRPQSWLSKNLEWILKTMVPYAVGLPLVGLVIQQQPMRIEPRIADADLGKHASLLLQSLATSLPPIGNRSYTRANTTDTILRQSILPPRNQLRSCDITDTQAANGYTSVAFEFMANEWQAKAPSFLHKVPTAPDVSPQVFDYDNVFTLESAFARAAYLYVDALLVQDADRGGNHSAALKQLKLDTSAYHTANKVTNTTLYPVLHAQDFVRGYFTQHPAWSTLLRANVSDIDVEYAQFRLANNITYSAVTIDIPLESTVWHRELVEVNNVLVESTATYPGTGDVVYEFDVANECGPSSCGIQNRGLAPEPNVIAFASCPVNGASCKNLVSNELMWIAGFGRRIEGASFELLDAGLVPTTRKAVVRNPREYHRVTVGLLYFPKIELDSRFSAECFATEGCLGHSYPLNTSDPVTGMPQYLVVGRKSTPIDDFGSGFDLENNLARGRPLVTRYTTSALVGYEILRPENFDQYVWSESLRDDQCSGKMERCVIHTELNHVFMEHPLQVSYTAALFFLFQNAQLIAQVPYTRTLDFVGNGRWVDLSVVVPFWQIIVGLVLGCLIVAIAIGWFLLKHEAITENSIDKLRSPIVLVRALADTTSFPATYFKLFLAPSWSDENEKDEANKKKTDTAAPSPPDALQLADISLRSIEFGPVPPQFANAPNGSFIVHMNDAQGLNREALEREVLTKSQYTHLAIFVQ